MGKLRKRPLVYAPALSAASRWHGVSSWRGRLCRRGCVQPPHAEPTAAAHRIPRARDGARERVIRAHVLNAAPSSMCLQVPEVLRRLPVHHLRTVARRRVPNARLRVREPSTRTNVVGFSAATHPTRRVRIVDHLLCSVSQCTQPLVPQHSLIPLAGAWYAACPRRDKWPLP